ncbi:hypothetical protein PVAND_006679 [Polypedilum vanderplanki]|uniref:Cuticle protein n=1 Tax=Polypedilum vanderplanki TaxID=319348 RepID=A0A9J6C3Z9_POLVA|nr:hypothetical protein PVAND_006679 [Polypedilum vanderplanki]
MFKLVVLSCLVSAAFAGIISAPATIAQVKTIVEPHSTIVETPTISHVGTAYKNIPTGVSHHSSSVVHSAANIVEPIYAHGVQKSVVSTPIVKKVVEHVPAVVPVAKVYAHEPVVAKTVIAEPYVAAPAVSYHGSYAHAAPLTYAAHAAPLAYSSAIYAPKAVSYSLPASYAHHW